MYFWSLHISNREDLCFWFFFLMLQPEDRCRKTDISACHWTMQKNKGLTEAVVWDGKRLENTLMIQCLLSSNKHVQNWFYCVRSPSRPLCKHPLYPTTTIFRTWTGSDFTASLFLSLPLSSVEHSQQQTSHSKEVDDGERGSAEPVLHKTHLYWTQYIHTSDYSVV